ncbi:uncharacterized protein LOC118518013 isoform X2 [Halichoerus grypus]
MTWVSELRFLVCTGKITALYEVVVRLPGGDVGFDKGKPVLGSSCCTREPWGAPDHTSRTPQKSLRICQGGHLHPEHCDHPTSSNLIFIKDKNFHLFCSPLYSQCLGQRRREMRKRNELLTVLEAGSPGSSLQQIQCLLITSEGLNNCASPESQGLSGFRLPPGMSLHFQLAGTVTSFPCTHGW